MGNDEAKRIILARRARFVAAALAGLNAAMCGGKSEPQPCLSVVAEDSGTPQPCLSPPSHPIDAATDAGADAPDDADAQPQPCLSPVPDDAG